MTTESTLIVFVALTGFALLVQAGILLAIFLSARKALNKLRVDFDELRESALPILNTTRDVLTRIAPKIEPVAVDVVKAASSMRAISSDLADMTARLRVQVEGAQTSVAEISDRMRQQALRLDGILTRLLDMADQAAFFLQRTVGVPARQLAGILAAAKAVLESLRAYQPAARRGPAGNDDETFV